MITSRLLNWSRNLSQAGRGWLLGQAVGAVIGQALSHRVAAQAIDGIGLEVADNFVGGQCVPAGRHIHWVHDCRVAQTKPA
jgi:hypothetical protein